MFTLIFLPLSTFFYLCFVALHFVFFSHRCYFYLHIKSWFTSTSFLPLYLYLEDIESLSLLTTFAPPMRAYESVFVSVYSCALSSPRTLITVCCQCLARDTHLCLRRKTKQIDIVQEGSLKFGTL